MNYMKAQPAEGEIIRVQNAEGEADTTARIIVQNQVTYEPKVSVIIPVHNVEAYLRECLDSVVNQTLKKIEIICIDDGSTDSSLSILREYAQKDPRISVLQQKNLHAGVARNAGIAVAKGKYLSFLDADDFFEADMLKRMCHQAEKDGSDVVMCTNSVYDDELKQHVRGTKFGKKYLKISPFQPLDVSDALYTISNPNAWTKLFLAKQIKNEEVRFESVISCNDVTFVCTMLSLAKRISLLNENLVHYRINSKANITEARAKSIDCFIKAAVKLHQNLKKRDILDSYIIAYLDRIKKSFVWELSHCSGEEEREKWTRLADQSLPPQIAAYITDKEEKISVIIPVYNTEKYLKQCLDSVINQTLKEIEIICVNDGSTDDSLELLKEYANEDSRIVVIDQKHQYQGCSRNNALKIARGEYIQFVDSDDLIREDACEKLYKNAKENDLDMLCLSGYNFTETPQDEQENPYWSYDKILSYLGSKKIFNILDIKHIAHGMPVSACLTIFRKSFLNQYDIKFPEGLYYEDNVFYIKSLTKASRVSIDPERYYLRRIRKGSTTQSWCEHFSDYFDITNIVLGYLKNIRLDNLLYDNYKKNYLNTCVRLYQTYGQTSDKKNYLKIKKLLAEYGNAPGYRLKLPRRRTILAAALAFVSLPYNILIIKVLRQRLCQYIIARLNALRIDIKNWGNKDNAVTIEAQNSKITSPGWFRNTQGEGKVLTSTENKGKIKISVIRDGKLSVNFRGPDVRFEGKRFPVWINYKSIKIDGKEVLSSPVAIWHDNPWRYEMPVKDGQKIWLEYERRAHPYSREELKETVLKLYPTSKVIQANIDVLVDIIYKAIDHEK